MTQQIAIRAQDITPAKIAGMKRSLEAATDPLAIVQIETAVESIEHLMRETGMYSTEQIRPVNELKMRARWKLGRLLAKHDRVGHRPKKGVSASPLSKLLDKVGLSKGDARVAQRIGTLPAPDLEKAFADARGEDILTTFTALIIRARPYWYQASRESKHRDIETKAKGANRTGVSFGPFPLIYADPPWKFQTYSKKGLERTPDQHYPTLTDDEIAEFKVGGKTVEQFSAKRAVLLLWCTSSNVHRALSIMERWGFDYKAHAVWVKDKTGLGLVFRNQHEVLLYGTKGAMPGPRYQPPSVFKYPRGRHSAKPPQIRKAIERMYPNFSKRTRLELFARSQIHGWTCHGNEAKN